MANAKRLDWVDAAKGISILLVVMMHSTLGVGQDAGDIGFMHYAVTYSAPFRMPEFFLISGLFLSYVIGRSWGRYADRRVVHYLYFYALWAIILLFFKTVIASGDVASFVSGIFFAVFEPYSILWFIYMLAFFSAATKLLHNNHVPHWLVLSVTAILQMLPSASGGTLIGYFADYFVFFYAGYAFAPQIFKITRWAQENIILAVLGLLVWAGVNVGLVFWPSVDMQPDHVSTGYASLPGVHLILAFAGATAICVFSALLARFNLSGPLAYIGERSLAVYVAFVIPMAIFRTVMFKLGIITDVGAISLLVMIVAATASLIVYEIIQKVGYGKFLYERPEWAKLEAAREKPDQRVKNGTPAE
ncbi:acyltransferase family protein [Maritalea mediterranea]|uniref:Acyltransferase family protein n=1 Tax=Maritalea mediterranea TaxID=2909667 RepID=A0ABS9EA31_9HYPH|nr:acyltransferase family protein [Maritalea mediterranea]MCF4098759.1 acyltransferase family protein [Maritalea mediterranea]